MAATNSKDLVLSYERADGKTHNMTIPDYRNDITDAEIKTGAKTILAQDIFLPDGVGLVKLAGAVKVETTKTEVPIADAEV